MYRPFLCHRRILGVLRLCSSRARRPQPGRGGRRAGSRRPERPTEPGRALGPGSLRTEAGWARLAFSLENQQLRSTFLHLEGAVRAEMLQRGGPGSVLPQQGGSLPTGGPGWAPHLRLLPRHDAYASAVQRSLQKEQELPRPTNSDVTLNPKQRFMIRYHDTYPWPVLKKSHRRAHQST